MIGIIFNYVEKGVAEDTVNNIKSVVNEDDGVPQKHKGKLKNATNLDDAIGDSGATPTKIVKKH